jgi:LysM repeat protein
MWVKEAKGMRATERENRGRARVLFVLLVVFSFSTPGMNKESMAGFSDPANYRLTNFYIIDVNIADALEGLAAIARAHGGNLFALVDRRVVRAVPVNMKLREGIGLTEAMAELARVHGYSCYWDLSAGAVVIGNEQSLRDYGTKETRLYDPGQRTAEEFVTALSAVIPKERLTVGLAGGFLQVTTGSLEHRIIGEKIPALRSVEEDSIAFAIKVKTVTAAGGGIRGLKLSRPPAASGPYLTRLNREEQVEAGRLTDGGVPEETFSLHAVLYRNNRQFIGELLPAVTVEGEGGATTGRKVGVTLDLTLLGKADGAILALLAEINRITDWQETAGGAPVPVIATEEAGAVLSLRAEESCVLSGLALATGGRETGRAGYTRTGSSWGELLFGGGQKPGEKRDLAIFINSLASTADYDIVAEIPAPVLPVAGTPAGSAGGKEEKTPEETSTAAVESTAAGSMTPAEGAVESTTLWEAEVIELGSLGQAQAGKPAPEPEKTEAPVVLSDEQALEPEQPEKPEVSVTLSGEPAPANPEAPAALTGGQEAAAGEPNPEVFLPGTAEVGLVITYKTKKGEDLPAVAAKYGIPVEALTRTNNLSPEAPLPAGTDLVIPIPVAHLYILEPGETIWRLARKYGVMPELLMEINQINDVTQLMIGQIIILPKPVVQVVEEN